MRVIIKDIPRKYNAFKFTGDVKALTEFLKPYNGYCTNKKRPNGVTRVQWQVKPNVEYNLSVREGDLLYIDEDNYLINVDKTKFTLEEEKES